MTALQRFINSFEYNYTGRNYFDLRRNLGMTHICQTAKKIISEALPIQCVEAVFLAVYLTMGMEDFVRIPLSFKSVIDGITFRHIVLAICCEGRWGALGISRKSSLMYKDLKYASLADLVQEYARAYTEAFHSLEKVYCAFPVSHDTFSQARIRWRVLRIAVPRHPWSDIAPVVNKYARMAEVMADHYRVRQRDAARRSATQRDATRRRQPPAAAAAPLSSTADTQLCLPRSQYTGEMHAAIKAEFASLRGAGDSEEEDEEGDGTASKGTRSAAASRSGPRSPTPLRRAPASKPKTARQRSKPGSSGPSAPTTRSKTATGARGAAPTDAALLPTTQDEALEEETITPAATPVRTRRPQPLRSPEASHGSAGKARRAGGRRAHRPSAKTAKKARSAKSSRRKAKHSCRRGEGDGTPKGAPAPASDPAKVTSDALLSPVRTADRSTPPMRPAAAPAGDMPSESPRSAWGSSALETLRAAAAEVEESLGAVSSEAAESSSSDAASDDDGSGSVSSSEAEADLVARIVSAVMRPGDSPVRRDERGKPLRPVF